MVRHGEKRFFRVRKVTSGPFGQSEESSRKESLQWWKGDSEGIGNGAWRRPCNADIRVFKAALS